MARGIASGSHLLRIRVASAVAVLGLIAVSLSAPSASATVQPEQAKAGIAWTSCTEPPAARTKQFQCAMVAVPLDWAKPNGTKIELAVIRRLASRPQQRIGSMFLNPGGPGQSGVDLVANEATTEFFDGWGGGRFDLVSWDIRARTAAHQWSASPARPPRTGSGRGRPFQSRRPSRRPTSARRSSWRAAAVR
jgi:hypothetical protein